MSSITYDELKACFKQSDAIFREKFATNRRLLNSVISSIARSENDNGWPLAMLRALNPELADALGHWSAGGYKDIRRAQESSSVTEKTHAQHLEAHFSLLPPWRGEAQHVSKDPGWLERLECGKLELKSFMGCCSPGHTFAYVSYPAAILKFSSLKTARLVGSLTTENMEGEVLLPNGAIFRVVSLDRTSKTVCLVEDASPRQ